MAHIPQFIVAPLAQSRYNLVTTPAEGPKSWLCWGFISGRGCQGRVCYRMNCGLGSLFKDCGGNIWS